MINETDRAYTCPYKFILEGITDIKTNYQLIAQKLEFIGQKQTEVIQESAKTYAKLDTDSFQRTQRAHERMDKLESLIIKNQESNQTEFKQFQIELKETAQRKVNNWQQWISIAIAFLALYISYLK